MGGQSRVNGDLVIGLVTIWKPEVKILELDIHVRQDELEKRPSKVSGQKIDLGRMPRHEKSPGQAKDEGNLVDRAQEGG